MQKIRQFAGFPPHFLVAIVILLAGTAVLPQSVRSDDLSIDSIELTVGPMFNVEALQWSIAGANNIPNILSELTWWNIYAPGSFLSMLVRHNRLVFSAEADFGTITSGSNTDYDYNGSNRSNVSMYSVNAANGGLVANASVGGGFSVISQTPGKGFNVDIVGGWYFSAQNLVVADGVQYYVSPPGTSQVHSGLSATYDASWTGPFFEISASRTFPGGPALNGGLRLHYALYNSVADWLNNWQFAHPVSFRQWSQGVGVRAELSLSIPFATGVGLAIGAHATIFTTVEGTDRLFYASSGSIDSLLNGATWKSLGVWIGIRSTALTAQ
ncbi:MAG TPA: hypothetical protein VMW73_02270 [Spirochaetia bacterium]|nr:hypothetical protein [Spirochaetia bacterium]